MHTGTYLCEFVCVLVATIVYLVFIHFMCIHFTYLNSDYRWLIAICFNLVDVIYPCFT